MIYYDQLSVAAYDAHPAAYEARFAAIPPRVSDIKLALSQAGNPREPHVVEVGCGTGRDAAEILPRVSSYSGFDPSAGMLAVARRNVPGANFTQADALTYVYPHEPRSDVIFAFTSLLHSDRSYMQIACGKIALALRPGGIFMVSLKERRQDCVCQEVKDSRLGDRRFYYYKPEYFLRLAGSAFRLVSLRTNLNGTDEWAASLARL